MPKQAVLFDLFFTLINPMKEEYSRVSEYSVLGMERREFEAYNGIDYPFRASGGIQDPYDMVRHILRGLDIDDSLIRRATDARLERIRRGLYGVEKKNLGLLRDLREQGFKIALVSNADAADVYHWKGSPLDALFDTVVFSYHAGVLKPDPRIFRLAADRLGLPPEQCFFVGDGGHEELGGARALGMTTILTTEYISGLWPERIPGLRNDADYEVARLEDIRDIVNQPSLSHNLV
ncbi:HAD-superfamily hydrolase [Treponema primitia ZAS-2]|uniref:HAD-superfamily hydrolase n=1 Tax=Treponema primitia (strain ATCC BAA-887 / DSM 12427 / ZAS-2) TaxID=545694 RepID=F5YQ73_TREPZ|nr:HAD-IA family hydrolase [Treponema primitia]AEF86056.1 HAD-superfamily hydrolase [Treponema primitia ZAS-2]